MCAVVAVACGVPVPTWPLRPGKEELRYTCVASKAIALARRAAKAAGMEDHMTSINHHSAVTYNMLAQHAYQRVCGSMELCHIQLAAMNPTNLHSLHWCVCACSSDHTHQPGNPPTSSVREGSTGATAALTARVPSLWPQNRRARAGSTLPMASPQKPSQTISPPLWCCLHSQDSARAGRPQAMAVRQKKHGNCETQLSAPTAQRPQQPAGPLA